MPALIGLSKARAQIVQFSGAAIPAAYNDGFSGAPTGTAQFPTLLNGYAARAPWHVAGVDYRVGISTGVSLADPITLPSGNKSSGTGVWQESTYAFTGGNGGVVWLNGNNQTLNGYDLSSLSAHGGAGAWTVYSNGNNNTVSNCNFKVMNSTSARTSGCLVGEPIGEGVGNGTLNGLTITNCVIDGNGAANLVELGALITYDQLGLVIQYCYLLNAPNDTVDAFYNLIMRWNLLYNESAFPAPEDADGLQMDGVNATASSPQCVFNTYYQPATGNVFNSCFSMPAQGSTSSCSIVNGAVDNNTVVLKGSAHSNYCVGGGPNGAATCPNLDISHNYIDNTPASGVRVANTTSPGGTTVGNIDMNTGGTITNGT